MMDSSDEEDDEDEQKSVSTRPRLAKKTVPELGDKESFLSFYVNFKLQIQSWNVNEDSNLFREYLETAIQKNNTAKSEYWTLRGRHSTWSNETDKLLDDKKT